MNKEMFAQIYSRLATRLGGFKVLLGLTVLLAGCTDPSTRVSKEGQQNWSESGVIAISRPAPEVQEVGSLTALGFMPSDHLLNTRSALLIERRANSISLLEGNAVKRVIKAEGLALLKPGTLRVLHKQKNPLWYAPDSYFTMRGLPIPAVSTKERYRRGGLGDMVIYIAKDIPVHDSMVNSTDVGGIRLAAGDMNALYETLQLGDPIEIRG